MTNEEFIQSITLPGEEWRDLVGFEEKYMVSSMGRFFSKERIVRSNELTSNPYKIVRRKLLHPSETNHGYLKITFYVDGGPKTFSAHRLIAKTFIPNPNNRPMIDHIDRNRKNNCVSNLRWCDISENMNNPLTRKHCSSLNKGRQHPDYYRPVVALRGDVVHKIYPSIKDAIEDGFAGCQISNVCAGRCKTHRGFRWMYLSDYESQVSMSKNSI